MGVGAGGPTKLYTHLLRFVKNNECIVLKKYSIKKYVNANNIESIAIVY